ncbi:hypothetical protein L345_14087, partial [Ophiophagus hannah]
MFYRKLKPNENEHLLRRQQARWCAYACPS